MFKLNAVRLMQEHQLMFGESVAWEDYKLGVKETLGLFLRQELKLTSDYYDEDGKSVFHTHVEENLKILLTDKSPDI